MNLPENSETSGIGRFLYQEGWLTKSPESTCVDSMVQFQIPHFRDGISHVGSSRWLTPMVLTNHSLEIAGRWILEARMGFIRQDRSTIRMSMLGLRDRGPALNGGLE